MWLLDTNIVSEFRKPRPNPAFLTWCKEKGSSSLYISTVTIAEIRVGIEKQADAQERQALLSWLETMIRPAFVGRILEVDEAELLAWRIAGIKLAKNRKFVPEPDLLISAIARQNRMTVATRNVKDFVATGVPLFNPFTGEHFNIG